MRDVRSSTPPTRIRAEGPGANTAGATTKDAAMKNDDERVEPVYGSADTFDRASERSIPAVAQNQWTAQTILVRVVLAIVVVLVMIGALLLILQNVFHVMSS